MGIQNQIYSAFAICWLPIQIVLVLKSMNPNYQSTLLITMQILSHVLAYSSSCVNPVLYAFLSENFRKALKKVRNKLEARNRSFGIQHRQLDIDTCSLKFNLNWLYWHEICHFILPLSHCKVVNCGERPRQTTLLDRDRQTTNITRSMHLKLNARQDFEPGPNGVDIV